MNVDGQKKQFVFSVYCIVQSFCFLFWTFIFLGLSTDIFSFSKKPLLSVVPSINFLGVREDLRPTFLFYPISKIIHQWWWQNRWNVNQRKDLILDFPYRNLIERLFNDPEVRNYQISRFKIKHFFMKKKLFLNHPSIKILLERKVKNLMKKLVSSSHDHKKRKKIARNIYKSFLKKFFYQLGRDFIKKYGKSLKLVEDKYQVNKEYLVSILFIESRLGKFFGKNPVLDVYNTLYHYQGNSLIKKLTRYLKNIRYRRKIQKKLKDYILKKKEWGYEQIKSLLIMNYKYGVDIHSLRGSWAGAFGYPQFIPSSYLKWAKDGDRDGKIDLFNWKDVFESIGNYLKNFGFKMGSVKKIKESIYRYNLSWDYVEAVYVFANALVK